MLLICGKHGRTVSHTANMDHFHMQAMDPLLKGQADEWERGQGPRVVGRLKKREWI